jgi:hypothetical protein
MTDPFRGEDVCNWLLSFGRGDVDSTVDETPLPISASGQLAAANAADQEDAVCAGANAVADAVKVIQHRTERII